MADDTFRVDPAVDIVAGKDSIRYLTPGGAFSLRDPSGIAAAVSEKCRTGATAADIMASYLIPEEREAAAQLLNFLQVRKVMVVEPAGDTANVDPAREWLRHFANARDVPLPPIDVRGDGALARSLRAKLASVGNDRSQGAAACIVAAFDTPHLSSLRQLNLEARNTETPFLPVWLERSTVRWGPMTLPCATGCLECLLHREQAGRRRADPVEAMDMPELTASLLLSDLAATFATGEIIRWALDAHVDTDIGVAWRFDWLTMKMSGSRVLRLPRCTVCGAGQGERP